MRSVRRGVVLAVLLLAAVPASALGFAKAMWGPGYRNGVSQFPIYKKLGVSIYEDRLDWSAIAPTRPRDPTNPQDPAYHWPAEIQQSVEQASVFHMRVLLQVMTTPGWANRRRPSNWAPLNPADYARFVAAASREYPSVHLWMIWGEPDRQSNFMPEADVKPGRKLTRAQQKAPHLYARILDAAYGALKAVSRHNVVIGGNTFAAGDIDVREWIENLRLPNGRPPRMDMYGHNPFGPRRPSLSGRRTWFGIIEFQDLRTMAQWIDQYLHPGIPIFISEYTIPTHPDQEFNFWVDPKVAAQWVSDALRISRGWRRIYAFGWVHLYDDPPVSYGGLISANGKPKPDFEAFVRG